MRKKNLLHLPAVMLSLLALLGSASAARACHGLTLNNLTITNSGSFIAINADSDPASCGCGPYYMEVQVNSASYPFTTTVPASTSPAWGTMPWFHTLLNVPNYTLANGWPDNCVPEPYNQLTISFGQLCPGTAYSIRCREIPAGSGMAGPWSTPYNFTTPGIAPTLNVTCTAFPLPVCVNSSVTLSASVNGTCNGNFTFSWSPTTNLSNPNSLTTNALITGPITYVLTVTDVTAGQTASAAITIVPNPAPGISLTSTIESSCNDSTGTISIAASGSSPFTYAWTGTSQTTPTISGMPSGTYWVTVTDANGCMDTMSVVLGDSCDFVWPGDANDDGVADMNDILAIGIGNGTNGTVRPGATINWIGQPSAPWGPTLLSGTDYKWIDCNGDGTIDLDDTLAVIQNFALTHNNRWGMPVYSLANPDLRLAFSNDTIAAGSSGTIDIYLGDTTTPATNIYGIAATIDFDYTQLPAQNMGIDISSTWLGSNGTDVMAIRRAVPNSGQLDIAITRYNQVAANGNGLIARIPFTASNALVGSNSTAQVPVSFSYVNIIDANEQSVAVNIITDTLTLFDPGPLLADAQTAAANQLGIYPNPITIGSGNDYVKLLWGSNDADKYQLQIFDPAGRLVQTANNLSGGAFTLHTQNLNAGVYMVQLQNSNTIKRAQLVITR